VNAPRLRWEAPARFSVRRADGGTLPADYEIEVLDRDGTPLRRSAARPFTFDATMARPGTDVTVIIRHGPDTYSFRLTVPEVFIVTSVHAPGEPSTGTPEKPASSAIRIAAVLALDFGTYGECAAIWDSAASAPDASELSDAQLRAVNHAIPNHGFTSPQDVETRAGVAFVGLDMADKRHEAWTAAFTVPPLEHRRLRPLVNERLELPDADSAQQTYMGSNLFHPLDRSAGAPAALLGKRGLKRALLAANPDPRVVAELVGAYKTLYAGAVAVISGSTEPDRRREPNQVQVTYPTRLPSRQRNDLIRALREDPELSHFDPGVDEATAVAIFDLSVRLGQRPELGISLLQARQSSAKDAGDANLISDYVLVIDVGAGTTDVALVEMKIEDKTPAEAAAAPGRYWQLAPYVLSSGGALHFGADQLTLEFFKALKDRLTDMGESPQTEFRRDPAAIPEFLRLWKAAERAKEKMLADPSPRSVSVPLDATPGGSPARTVQLQFEPDLRYTAQRFAQRIAALAVGIAKAGLQTAEQRSGTAWRDDSHTESADAGEEADSGADAGPRAVQLDRVVLAGQTFRSPFIRHEVETALRAFLHGENRKATFELACYQDHLKSGASLGAAYGGGTWAVQTVAENTRVIEELRAGHNRFSLQTRTLWANLPAEFQDREHRRPIFQRGDRLRGEPSPRSDNLRWTRSRPFEMWTNVAVDRVDAEPLELEAAREQQQADDLRIAWCNFLFPGFREAQDDQELRPAAKNAFMTFEVDEREYLRLYVHHSVALPLDLSEGTPRQFGLETVDGGAAGDQVVLAKDGLAATSIFLNYISPVTDGGKALIEAGEALPLAVSVNAAEGDAQLAVLLPEGSKTLLVPKEHRWVSLSVDGQLRSHAEEPPVKSRPHDGSQQATFDFLRQSSDEEAWAIELTMQPENHYHEESDPFSGTH
jgi:hypothetical protein